VKSRQQSGFLLVVLAYLSFVSLGLPDGLNGVAWPSIRATFDLPIDALGGLLVTFTLGYLISSFGSGRLLARMTVGTLLAASCLATAISLTGYALAPAWSVMVAFALLAGLGAGAIDAGLNTFAATEFSARMVNWLHACYGVGAATGPVIMTGVLAAHQSWRRGYAIVAVWQFILAACFGLTRKWWPGVRVSETRAAAINVEVARVRSTLRLPVAWLSMAVFFVYTGTEAAAGVWAYTLFTGSRGASMVAAGTWVSVYWGSLFAGRVLAGLLVSRVSAHRLLRFSLIGVAVGAVALWLNVTSLASYSGLALMGLAAAAVFPSLIATTPARLGSAHAANAIGFQIAAAVLGQSLLPGAVGLLARRFGLEVIGPALLVAALLLFVLYEMLNRFSERHGQERRPG
jgi:fucose permease